MKKLLTTLSILLIATASYAQTYTVERVIDGDTLKLTNGERVRLTGIDTQESRINNKAKRDSKRTGQDLETIIKMGQEATEFVKTLIKSGQEVQLEFDVQERDKYRRLLAYVYILICKGECAIEAVQGHKYVRLDDGWYDFINATIVMSGYATPMTIPPNVKYAELFKELYKEARDNKRGLWVEKPYHNFDSYLASIDYSCMTDNDCEIKDVHNCCGYDPRCVNKNSETDTDFVEETCGKEGLFSICGHPSINDCKCVEKKCQGIFLNKNE